MFEPFKISRVLPPHELNARRARKRVLMPLPPTIFKRPVASPTFVEPAISPNQHVYNHGADRFTHHQ